jgi:hypothetical protein
VTRVTILSYFAFGVLVIVVFWALLGVLFALERTAPCGKEVGGPD